MPVPILADTSAFSANGEPPAPAVEPTPVAEPPKAEPEPVEPAADAAPAEPTPDPGEDDAEWEPGFRNKKGQFRKASKKEALGEMRHRINTLTAKFRGAQEELTRLRVPTAAAPSAVAATTSPTSVSPAAPNGDDPEPTFDQFEKDADPLGAYMKAVGRWSARQERKAIEAEAAQTRQQAETAKGQEALAARVAAFAESHDDFESVVFNPELQVSPVIRAVLDAHEQGPALAYYLGSHLDDALALAVSSAGTPVDAQTVAAMGRLLSSRLAAASTTGAAPVARTQAPRPLTPVRTSRPAREDGPPDPATSSLDDHFRYYNKQDQEARRRRA